MVEKTPWQRTSLTSSTAVLPAGDLITQFGPESSKPNLVPLLEVLIALPEELHSRQLRLGLNRRKQLDEYFHSQVPNITKILVSYGWMAGWLGVLREEATCFGLLIL